MDLALRENCMGAKKKRIIPVLVDGSMKDYQGHFLGGYEIVDARRGITKEVIEKVAPLALGLGVEENPYGT